jgi:hypothetical protein
MKQTDVIKNAIFIKTLKNCGKILAINLAHMEFSSASYFNLNFSIKM